MTSSATFERAISRIEQLTHNLEQASDPSTRSAAREFVGAVLELHREGISRILHHLDTAGEPARSVVEDLRRDDLIVNLMLLHDLHPDDLTTRVGSCLNEINDQLGRAGPRIALVQLDGSSLALRYEGIEEGCPSASRARQGSIEAAIRSVAPEIDTIDFIRDSAPETRSTLLLIITLTPERA